MDSTERRLMTTRSCAILVARSLPDWRSGDHHHPKRIQRATRTGKQRRSQPPEPRPKPKICAKEDGRLQRLSRSPIQCCLDRLPLVHHSMPCNKQERTDVSVLSYVCPRTSRLADIACTKTPRRSRGSRVRDVTAAVHDLRRYSCTFRIRYLG